MSCLLLISNQFYYLSELTAWICPNSGEVADGDLLVQCDGDVRTYLIDWFNFKNDLTVLALNHLR